MTTPIPSQAAMSRFAEIEPRAEATPRAASHPAPLYEARLRITETTEYGTALAGVLAGTVPMPPEGVRLDIAFEGTVTGERLRGTAVGVDYAYLRADGRIELHIHARVTTPDSANVAMFADGTGARGAAGLVELREMTRLHASDPRYRWVNTLALWGTGTADLAAGEIRVCAAEA